jgi:hypothetical protein
MEMLVTAPKESLQMKGRVTVRGFRAGALDAVMPLAKTLMEWRRQAWVAEAGFVRDGILRSCDELAKRIDQMLEAYSTGVVSTSENLIMTGSLTGRDLLVQYLLSGTVYSGVNYGALGTGTTTPAAGDTQLTTESARATPTIQNDISNNKAQLQFYFPDANLANATYQEAGCFMNGTASANTGKIFNHALLGTPYTKTTGTDTTLEIDITFT